MEFLQAALARGPVPAAEVGSMAREHGLSGKAVRMGREALGVEVGRNGFGPGGQSVWSLPGAPMDAPLPEEKAGAGREEPSMSEPLLPAIDGFEVLGLEQDEPCTYCGERGGGPVYLMQGLFKGAGREALHQVCAGYWFEWYSAVKRDGKI
jgi:hypothetical protein